MAPDLDGRQRLKVVTGPDGKKTIDSTAIADRWNEIRRRLSRLLSPAPTRPSSDEAAAYRTLQQAAEQTYKEFRDHLDEYFRENVGRHRRLFRLPRSVRQRPASAVQEAPYQKQRRWERMMELRAEAAKWIKDVEEQEKAFVSSLYGLLDDPEKPGDVERTGQYHGKPVPMPATWNPFRWERMEQINFAVTYGLTAIGLCLMLGFCTRLAALGGAAFMAFVVMTQPAFPTIYPPDPAVVGHALLVNKDFVEMVALLVVAAVGAGRWGGLDFFWRGLLGFRGIWRFRAPGSVILSRSPRVILIASRHSERSEESSATRLGQILRCARMTRP